MHAGMDMKTTLAGKHPWLLYALAPAMRPRMLLTLDQEGKLVSCPVRVGQAVDVVAQVNPACSHPGQHHHAWGRCHLRWGSWRAGAGMLLALDQAGKLVSSCPFRLGQAVDVVVAQAGSISCRHVVHAPCLGAGTDLVTAGSAHAVVLTGLIAAWGPSHAAQGGKRESRCRQRCWPFMMLMHIICAALALALAGRGSAASGTV